MKSLLLLTFFFLACSMQKLAAIGFEDAIFPELVTSTRALAMGNAFICRVDDASAAFYNPAGLGTVRFKHLHLSNFNFETNKDILKGATSGSISDALSGFGNMFSLNGFRQVMGTNVGDIAHARFSMLPNFTMRYLTVGYMLAKRMRATVANTSSTGFEYADRTDTGPYAAINLSLFGGILKFGVTGVLMYRSEVTGTADPSQSLSIASSQYKKGTTVYSVAGARLTFPFVLLPTFALKMHNVFGNGFYGTSGAGAPATIPQSIDAGFSITPQIGQSTRLHVEFNYKDLTGTSSGVSMVRRMLLGMELDFSRTFFLRLGYGDGFGSGGIGIRSTNLEFDVTTYAVDTTSSAFRGAEDRRFVLGFSSGF